jgi:ferredoxin
VSEEHGIEVAIDRSLCIGSGPCFVIAPGAFALDDNMKAIVRDPARETAGALLEAARECPTQAIYLSQRGKPLYP